MSDLNDTYLDFGGGNPQVFSWQMILGGPFTAAILMILGIPLIAGLITAASGFGLAEVVEFSKDLSITAREPVTWMYLCVMAVGLAVWLKAHSL
ncbi:hypothetical protein PL026_33785, partial [Pseudomonas extremaustralis]|nr:hypothetical protein [Pseudomonas extremaustralis]